MMVMMMEVWSRVKANTIGWFRRGTLSEKVEV